MCSISLRAKSQHWTSDIFECILNLMKYKIIFLICIFPRMGFVSQLLIFTSTNRHIYLTFAPLLIFSSYYLLIFCGFTCAGLDLEQQPSPTRQKLK